MTMESSGPPGLPQGPSEASQGGRIRTAPLISLSCIFSRFHSGAVVASHLDLATPVGLQTAGLFGRMALRRALSLVSLGLEPASGVQHSD